MKKTFLLFCFALLCTSCINNWWDHFVPRIWFVRNATGQTLILKCPVYESDEHISNPIVASGFEYRELVLTPNYGGSMICRIDSKPRFNYYFIQSAEAFGEDVSWQILSEDGEVLKTWKYSDRNLPGQRFFEESEWHETQSGLWPACYFNISFEDI